MAKFNPQRLKTVEMDGEKFMAPESSTLNDVLPADVNAVTVYDASGGSQLVPRSQFNRPLPEGFTTHLTHVEKGAASQGAVSDARLTCEAHSQDPEDGR